MNLMATTMLETTRLILRELHLGDREALHAIESKPEVTRYLPFDPRTPTEILRYVETALTDQKADPRHTFDLAITLKESDGSSCACDPLIGRCGLGIRRPEHSEALIWYELHPAHWGKGYAHEAARCVLDFGFRRLRLHRIWADCDPRNVRSCQVAEHLGMKLEGLIRENYFLKGEWCSTAVYGMLETELQPALGNTR